MPHQCVRCGKLIENGSSEILKGCDSCGGKLFFFIKAEKLEKMKSEHEKIQISDKDRKKIESDVQDLIGPEYSSESPVILNFESIRVTKPGKFELDLVNLFNEDQPLVYKLEEGKYMIDVATTFSSVNKDSSRIIKSKKKKLKKSKK